MSLSDSHELKALNVQSATVQSEIAALESEINRLRSKLNERKSALNTIQQRIGNLSRRPAPVVSEHALLRYLERVKGIDLEQAAAEILNEHNIRAIEFAGNCRIKSNGVEFVVSDRVVVTVIGNEKRACA